jgi:hypothetical protein
MSVSEKPLTLNPKPINLCGATHLFVGFAYPFNVPPGTVCSCGQKVVIYEPCPTCRQTGPMLKDAIVLQEGDHYA